MNKNKATGQLSTDYCGNTGAFYQLIIGLRYFIIDSLISDV